MGLMVEAGVGRFIDRLAASGHQESFVGQAYRAG
jgi:hypothetical protein